MPDSILAFAVLVLLVGAGWGATLFQAARREAAAETRYPPKGQFVEVDGRRVHAVVTGSGPDLVLIHGSSGNTRDFTFSFVDQVKDRYRVIVFDRPGLGYSDRLPEGSEGIFVQASVLSKAAAKLGAPNPIVLGQSLGGAVALAWALDHPAAALVTVSGPSHPWDTPLPTLYRITSAPLGSAIVVPLITAWVPRGYVREQIDSVFPPGRMPEGYDSYIGAGLTLRRESMRANAAQRARLLQDVRRMQGRYDELTLPFELVHGDADTTVDYDLHVLPMAQEAPTVQVTRLQGAGHMPHQTRGAAVADTIDRAAARAGLR